MHNLIQDIRYAVRMLRRSPGFTTVAVIALALGIGANTAVFTVVNGVLLRPMPFPESERLFLVSYSPRHFVLSGQMSPSFLDHDYLEFRREDRLFERIATFTSSNANLTGSADALRVLNANVTLDFFSILRAHPAIGRTFLADEDQAGRDHVVLLSDKLWRSRFEANSRILGKTIQLDGMRYIVIGVMPAGFTFPYDDDTEVWTPFAYGMTHIIRFCGRCWGG